MNKLKNKLIMALFLAPTIIIPGVFIPSLLMGLHQDFLGMAYDSSSITTGAAILVFAACLVAYIGSLFYGLPVYLVLRHFERAKLTYLLAAAIIPFAVIAAFEKSWYSFVFFCAFSVPVAICFWLIVAPLSPSATRLRNRVATVIAVITIGLFLFYMTGELVFEQELRQARLHRALTHKAPKPQWWDQVQTGDQLIDSLEKAQQLYQSKVLCCHGSATAVTGQREFFKLAYAGIWQRPDDGKLVMDLVHKMALPEIGYEHQFGLQGYALDLPTRQQANPNTTAAVLVAMFGKPEISANDLHLALSYSFIFIAANHRQTSGASLLPLCGLLFTSISREQVSGYEFNVFRHCLQGLRRDPQTRSEALVPQLEQFLSSAERRHAR